MSNVSKYSRSTQKNPNTTVNANQSAPRSAAEPAANAGAALAARRVTMLSASASAAEAKLSRKSASSQTLLTGTPRTVGGT